GNHGHVKRTQGLNNVCRISESNRRTDCSDTSRYRRQFNRLTGSEWYDGSGAGRTRRTWFPLNSLNALFTLLSLDPLRALFSWGTLDAWFTLLSLDPLWALFSCRTLDALNSLRSDGTLRSGYRKRNPVRPIKIVKSFASIGLEDQQSRSRRGNRIPLRFRHSWYQDPFVRTRYFELGTRIR